jgi:hypothetical protein
VKYFYFFLIFSYSCLNVFSEDSDEEQAYIDSLNGLINNPKSHDTTVVSAYKVVAELLYY